MFEKLKPILADDAIFIAILLLLVGVVSFGLGRQSVLGVQATKMNNDTPSISVVQAEEHVEGKTLIEVGAVVELVASKSGSRYHLLECPGASQIKESNKIYFNSKEEAMAAGYTPAGNCPQLQ